jgi:hypothetical protein
LNRGKSSPNNRDRGEQSAFRPSHTTRDAGPHPAVRRMKLRANDQRHESFGSSEFFLTCASPTSVSVPLPEAFGASLLLSTTPTFHRKGQHLLFGPVFLPLFAHETRRLLAFPSNPLTGYRSDLRSSFPVQPVRFSAFLHGSTSIALPNA